MHTKLTENPTFLKYYAKWQSDPTSVVFVGISEMFRTHGLVDDAIKVAEAGLKRHPGLISGRLALAKAYLANNDKKKAREQAISVLGLMPNNETAKEILADKYNENDIDFEEEVTEELPLVAVEDESPAFDSKPWHTVTMARILTAQGDIERAKNIYASIIANEPDNETAMDELSRL
jgi:tetratricopeptide (TPR) repeat protein